jgi:hypothetical protein
MDVADFVSIPFEFGRWAAILLVPLALALALAVVWFVGLIAYLLLNDYGVTLTHYDKSDSAQLTDHLLLLAHGGGVVLVGVVGAVLGSLAGAIREEWDDWRQAVDELRQKRRESRP